MSIELTSTAFQPGVTIPKQYTGEGKSKRPVLLCRKVRNLQLRLAYNLA